MFAIHNCQTINTLESLCNWTRRHKTTIQSFENYGKAKITVRCMKHKKWTCKAKMICETYSQNAVKKSVGNW